MQKPSGKWRTSELCGNNCNLQSKWFFFDNNENAKLMKVSFPILMYLKNKVWRKNNKFNQDFLRRLSFINKFKTEMLEVC